MSNHFKVHELLSGEELAELEAFAREPGRTIDECHEWLQAKGHTLSRGAVGNWMAKLREQIALERVSASGSFTRAFMDAAKSGGSVGVTDAAILQVGQMLLEAGVEKANSGEVDPQDLSTLALALQRLSLAKARVEDVRADFENRQREALEQAQDVVKSGGDGASVVETIKKALGITQEAA